MISIGLRHNSVVSKIVTRMSSINSNYEQAIHKLNLLQSNKSTIEQIKTSIKTGQKCTNIEDMENYLSRIGISLSKLDELSVIHVAGTKGKGSTSAMCESILRHHGFRTGFYSSPHLLAARERIRLDGRPMSRDMFAKYLHRVHTLLKESQEFDGDMPKYFAFLTVLAFHVFLQERVDVAIVEVGIGGVVDYTNVLRKVPVVGITALGLDHTSILGHTLAEIAAAKAGIMKPTCEAYTVPQPTEAMEVLSQYAGCVGCPLTIAPDYSSYTFTKSETPHLPVDLDAYKSNASLAIQLAHAWIRSQKKASNGIVNKVENGLINSSQLLPNGNQPNGIEITIENGLAENSHGLSNGNAYDSKYKNGLLHYSQKFPYGNGLIAKDQKDGTKDSIKIKNVNQFNRIDNRTDNDLTISQRLSNGNHSDVYSHKVQNGPTSSSNRLSKIIDMNKGDTIDKLILNLPYETMEGLRQCKWPGRYHTVQGDYAKFYLDGAHTKESMEICAKWFKDSCDRISEKALIFSATGDRNGEVLLQPLKDISFKRVFFVIPTAYKVTTSNHDNFSLVEQEELIQRCRNHAQIWQNYSQSDITVLECVSDALHAVKKDGNKPAVLITGSLHLVGAALSILDPNLST